MNLLKKPRRILITGASQGIGRSTALELSSQGHTVILAARHRDALEAVRDQIQEKGGRCELVILDVTNAASVEAAVAEVLASGPVDVLVNNAGSADQHVFLDQSEPVRRAEMEINYFGALRTINALLPAFVARGEGTIVNVSSLLGSSAAPTTANYCASKAALEAFSYALRGEVACYGVRVTVFVAPHTQTELGKRTEFRGVKSLPVDYVAKQLIAAIDTQSRRYAAGPVYAVLLRLAAWWPQFMERQMSASVDHLLTSARLRPASDGEI